MLEGLEATELNSINALEDNPTFRIDSEFFRKELLTLPRFPLCLGKIAKIKSGTTPADRDDGLTEGVVLLKTTDIRNSVLSPEDQYYRVSQSIAARMRETKLKARDVLINIVGATTDVIGRVAFVPDDFPEANITQAMALLRVDEQEIDPTVLFSFLTGRYGKLQVERLARPTGQYNLNLQELASFRVPKFTTGFSKIVSTNVLTSYELLSQHRKHIQKAEQTLLHALNLGNWQPPEPLTYTRRVSDTFAAKRLDSEFFAPRVSELLDHLSSGGKVLRDMAPARHEQFTPGMTGTFEYIEISNVSSDGIAAAETVPCAEAPSRATQYVRKGDVITSSVRPVRRLSAIIKPEQDGFVCSSGFVVLRPVNIAPELLLTYLRLPPVCELMDLHTSASLYPAISERDLLNLPFPIVASKIEADIVKAVQQAHAARREARELLERAKRAVEIAIEISEIEALAALTL